MVSCFLFFRSILCISSHRSRSFHQKEMDDDNVFAGAGAQHQAGEDDEQNDDDDDDEEVVVDKEKEKSNIEEALRALQL